MRHYLIVYDRSTGTLLRCSEYRSVIHGGKLALNDRFACERRYRDQPHIEVVVLAADSLDAVKVTHGRYFYTVAELAARALETVPPRQN